MAAAAYKTFAIDLGLAVLCALKQPDQTLTCADIAEVCNCTPQAINNIEMKALKKLRKKKHYIKDYV